MLNKKVEFAGAFSFDLNVHEDERGLFVKTYNTALFEQADIDAQWQEQYISTSKPGVLRGMHFQNPPHDHKKMVLCIGGEVTDVIVDLRMDSAHYGQHHVFTLNPWQGVYIPGGFAHGFQALEDDVEMLYLHTESYDPEYEGGIRYDDPSIDVQWPVAVTDVSDRDGSHPLLKAGFEGIVPLSAGTAPLTSPFPLSTLAAHRLPTHTLLTGRYTIRNGGSRWHGCG